MTRRFLVLISLALLGSTVDAQPSPEALGPAVGTRVPDFSALDQFGRTQTLRSTLGPDGAMLVFYRSADW